MNSFSDDLSARGSGSFSVESGSVDSILGGGSASSRSEGGLDVLDTPPPAPQEDGFKANLKKFGNWISAADAEGPADRTMKVIQRTFKASVFAVGAVVVGVPAAALTAVVAPPILLGIGVKSAAPKIAKAVSQAFDWAKDAPAIVGAAVRGKENAVRELGPFVSGEESGVYGGGIEKLNQLFTPDDSGQVTVNGGFRHLISQRDAEFVHEMFGKMQVEPQVVEDQGYRVEINDATYDPEILGSWEANRLNEILSKVRERELIAEDIDTLIDHGYSEDEGMTPLLSESEHRELEAMKEKMTHQPAVENEEGVTTTPERPAVPLSRGERKRFAEIKAKYETQIQRQINAADGLSEIVRCFKNDFTTSDHSTSPHPGTEDCTEVKLPNGILADSDESVFKDDNGFLLMEKADAEFLQEMSAKIQELDRISSSDMKRLEEIKGKYTKESVDAQKEVRVKLAALRGNSYELSEKNQALLDRGVPFNSTRIGEIEKLHLYTVVEDNENINDMSSRAEDLFCMVDFTATENSDGVYEIKEYQPENEDNLNLIDILINNNVLDDEDQVILNKFRNRKLLSLNEIKRLEEIDRDVLQPLQLFRNGHWNEVRTSRKAGEFVTAQFIGDPGGRAKKLAKALGGYRAIQQVGELFADDNFGGRIGT